MKDYTNYPCYHIEHQRFNSPDGVKTKFKKLITFAVPFCAVLLNWIMSCFVSCYFITNRTVSNEMVNICQSIGLHQ